MARLGRCVGSTLQQRKRLFRCTQVIVAHSRSLAASLSGVQVHLSLGKGGYTRDPTSYIVYEVYTLVYPRRVVTPIKHENIIELTGSSMENMRRY